MNVRIVCFVLLLATVWRGEAFGAITRNLGTDGRLTIATSAGDDVIVACELRPVRLGPQREVTINGNFSLDVEPCAVITALEITGDDAPNRIQLGAMLPTDFVQLAATAIASRGGTDTIAGSFVRDAIVAGVGDDSIDAGEGDDSNVWNNGDGTDAFDGGAGNDEQVVNGRASADVATIVFDAASRLVVFRRDDPGTFAVSMAATENLRVSSLGGDDIVDASALPAGHVTLEIDGGEGADRINGSRGADRLSGGPGNDIVVGFPGDDIIALGEGDDVGTWNNGDNTDAVQGDAGTDVQIVNGAPAGDVFEIEAATAPFDARLRRTNLVPFAVVMGSIERLEVNGGDGADQVATRGLAGIAQVLDGGAPATFPGDALSVSGFAGALQQTPVVTLPGSGSIAHSQFEFASGGTAQPAAAPLQVPAMRELARYAAIVGVMLLAAAAVRRR